MKKVTKVIAALFIIGILISSCATTYRDKSGCWGQNRGMSGYR
jgi:preprotein translocase subunit SecG